MINNEKQQTNTNDKKNKDDYKDDDHNDANSV